MDSGVRSGSRAYPGTFQTTAGFSAGSRYADFLAAESVRTAIPAPMRALRKQLDGQQRVYGGGRDVCSGRHFSLVQDCCAKYLVSLLSARHTLIPFHHADYLKFGILVI